MFNIGWGEILIIVLLVLIIFGSTRIPQLGDALGKGIKNFQKAIRGRSDEDKDKDKENGSKKD